MNIVLVGFMGSGKSRVADVLSQRLGWTRIDTDDLIEKKAGCSIPDIFRKQGEKAFRAMERDAVIEAAQHQNVVIATGGGVPMDERNLVDLGKTGYIVWLKVKPEVVLQRSGDLSTRPLIDKKDPLGSVVRRLEERTPFYAKAHAFLETDRLSVNEVADKILSLVPGLQK